jgi:hypothetical protein
LVIHLTGEQMKAQDMYGVFPGVNSWRELWMGNKCSPSSLCMRWHWNISQLWRIGSWIWFNLDLIFLTTEDGMTLNYILRISEFLVVRGFSLFIHPPHSNSIFNIFVQ